ncbi:hypothetical protein HPB49_004889 [Dermacentor silvarum]|uniref:Uncharacterized protein n=1 Tax=Dermacentor silvarum TaxID=543639 RepID=A0ACB8DVD7_DERSI|nr:hypothetical protein HPB49_004889 [Dermacentor silvarum]
MVVFSSLLGCTVCKHCLKGGFTVRESTKLRLATKLKVVCPSCGTIKSSWTSLCKKDSQAFEVNVHAIMAMKQIGKGQTALNNFWAAINVSYRGLILDAIVLSNHCLGCQTGPKPGDAAYDSWHQHHICQKNTDAKSQRMEVKAA